VPKKMHDWKIIGLRGVLGLRRGAQPWGNCFLTKAKPEGALMAAVAQRVSAGSPSGSVSIRAPDKPSAMSLAPAELGGSHSPSPQRAQPPGSNISAHAPGVAALRGFPLRKPLQSNRQRWSSSRCGAEIAFVSTSPQEGHTKTRNSGNSSRRGTERTNCIASPHRAHDMGARPFGIASISTHFLDAPFGSLENLAAREIGATHNEVICMTMLGKFPQRESCGRLVAAFNFGGSASSLLPIP
jgi:hypothetical protein